MTFESNKSCGSDRNTARFLSDKGKSYYGDVASNVLWDKFMRFIKKNHHIGGKTKLPVAAEDSIQLKFLPEEVHP